MTGSDDGLEFRAQAVAITLGAFALVLDRNGSNADDERAIRGRSLYGE
jgi:hypothetical protein